MSSITCKRCPIVKLMRLEWIDVDIHCICGKYPRLLGADPEAPRPMFYPRNICKQERSEYISHPEEECLHVCSK